MSSLGKREEAGAGQWKTELRDDTGCIREEKQDMNDAFHSTLGCIR